MEEYKLHYEHPGEGEPIQQPVGLRPRDARAAGATRRGGAPAAAPGPSRGYIVAVGAVGVVIVLLVYALLSGGGSTTSPTASTPAVERRARHRAGTSRAPHKRAPTSPTAALASLKVEPTRRCTCA